MSHDCRIARERQCDAFRVALQLTGLTFKQLAHRCGHPERTLRSWAAGQAAMPFAAIDGLLRGFPPAAIDLLLPDGFALVVVPDCADHAEFAAAVMDFAVQYTAARDPRSEAGVAIGAGEDEQLVRRRLRVAGGGTEGNDSS